MTNTIDETVPAIEDPVPSHNWFENVPADWAGWIVLRAAVNENLQTRDNFRDWMANHLDPEKDALQLGLGLCAAGAQARALPYLRSCDDELCQVLVGRVLADHGQRVEAARIWSSLGRSSKVGVRATLWLLEVHLVEPGELPDEDLLAQLKELGAQPADLAYAEGLVAERRGDHPGATASWRVALQHDPSHADALFHLAVRLDLDGCDEESIELYERFCSGEILPHTGAIMNLGVLYEDREDFHNAAGCFRLVLKADPTSERARRYLKEAEAGIDQYYDETREKRADRQSAVLRVPVTDFELSVRARNCLQRMNIHTLGDLVCRTESELLAFKNFGETSLQEVQEILASKGLRLGMMSPGDWKSTPAPTPGVEPTVGDDITDQPISSLDLSVRARAALATLGIKTVGDLTNSSVSTLLSCRNFGQTSLDEIKSKLSSLGLSLAV